MWKVNRVQVCVSQSSTPGHSVDAESLKCRRELESLRAGASKQSDFLWMESV